MITSSLSQLSGVLLIELIEKNIQGILRKEDTNMCNVYLYRTGNYWIAFEKSAYQLNKYCRNACIFPIKVTGIPFPFVIASIKHYRLERVTKVWDCLVEEHSERVYQCRTALSNSVYQAWHDKEVAEIMMAINNGIIL